MSQPLQACVTELIEPFLDYVIVSSNLHHVREPNGKGGAGDRLRGRSIPDLLHARSHVAHRSEQMALPATLELFPQLHGVNILRHWAGVCDRDAGLCNPIDKLQPGEALDNFFMDVGWGTWGFRKRLARSPGKCLAETIATGKAAVLMEPFAPSRVSSGKFWARKAAASVSAVGPAVRTKSIHGGTKLTKGPQGARAGKRN